MSLPSEYVVGDALRSVGDMIVCRAEHPIHGTVDVYLPDDNLPWELSERAKKRLYQNGRHMRNMSLLDMPFVAKALEVSQNPKEPYIVTRHEEHNLEEFISNGVVIQTKRMFSILLQVFDAIINLTSNGWFVGRLHPSQIKVPQPNTGDVSFNVIEGGAEQCIEMTPNAPVLPADKRDGKIKKPSNQSETSEESSATIDIKIRDINETKSPVQSTHLASSTGGKSPIQMATGEPQIRAEHKQSITIQGNIFLLGNVAYQLLFGRKYEVADKIAAVNIKKLPKRWRIILEKALNQDTENYYDRYEVIRYVIDRALNRNKRIAVYSVPFWILLILISGYYSYEKYHEHKIMTSEAGQAIKRFLDIINKTDNEIPELKEPQMPIPKPDDSTILKPFDEIESVGSADPNLG
jgi:hypothetical protein